MARGNGHLPAADVRNLARGEDARVAGVVDLARRNGCPPRRALLIWRGGKTPALRAFMTCEGKLTPATAGFYGFGEGERTAATAGVYGFGIGGIGGGKAGNTKVAGPRKSTVKQKTKLAMDPPKQGAFCKESNIREVVQKRANALRNCYEQQLLANPDLSGKIIVFWKIGLDGKVTDASIKSTTMNNARVESCLTQTVRRLRFDKPDGGICVVEFPFIFTSAQ